MSVIPNKIHKAIFMLYFYHYNVYLMLPTGKLKLSAPLKQNKIKQTWYWFGEKNPIENIILFLFVVYKVLIICTHMVLHDYDFLINP